MDARKILLVIFDGLGDRPLTELGHKTPLEATPKPNLDWFASNGVNGLVDPIAPGVAAGSDTGHLARFGYDPHEVYTGRGPFEAAAKVTAKAVNAFTKQSYKILKSHPVNRARVAKGEPPANAVVLRGAGVFPEIVPITERFHLTAAGIAGVALIRGMFRTIGMDAIDVPGPAGCLDP